MLLLYSTRAELAEARTFFAMAQSQLVYTLQALKVLLLQVAVNVQCRALQTVFHSDASDSKS